MSRQLASVAVACSPKETHVIVQKFWSAFMAQINKIANIFWEADPDRADAVRVRSRGGAAQGGPPRASSSTAASSSASPVRSRRTGRTCRSSRPRRRPISKAGDRATAAKFALELQKAKAELAANEQQLQMHETAYGNNLKKIQHANDKLIELREKIQKYDAELKMSAAEAEIAKLAESFDMNLTTDFGQIEAVIQQKIDQNRGKVRVAADLSSEGIAEIQAEERMQSVLAEEALTNFEVELGLKSPETTPVASATKDLGPAQDKASRNRRTERSRRPAITRTELRRRAAQEPRSEMAQMANGQPRPSVLCRSLPRRPGPRRPGDLAVRRRRTRRRRRTILERRAEAGGGRRGEAGQLRHHDGQGIQLRRLGQAPRSQGDLQLHADGRPHGAVRDQRVGRLGPDHLRQQRLQARESRGRRRAARTSRSSWS